MDTSHSNIPIIQPSALPITSINICATNSINVQETDHINIYASDKEAERGATESTQRGGGGHINIHTTTPISIHINIHTTTSTQSTIHLHQHPCANIHSQQHLFTPISHTQTFTHTNIHKPQRPLPSCTPSPVHQHPHINTYTPASCNRMLPRHTRVCVFICSCDVLALQHAF